MALPVSESCVCEGFIWYAQQKKTSAKGSVPPKEKVEVSQLWAGQSLDGKGLSSVRRRMKSQCVVELGWDLEQNPLQWILTS